MRSCMADRLTWRAIALKVGKDCLRQSVLNGVGWNIDR